MDIKPDWNEIASNIGEELPREALQAAWSTECNKWLESVARNYGDNYRIHHSANFSILSNESGRYVQLFSAFLERTLQRILSTLEGVASDQGYGKHVVMIFGDVDQYYDYVSMFYPEEGEFGFSSGMYINEGYGHLVFPTEEISTAESIALHELTHACLSHLPLPTWLDEGLALLMENALAGKTLYLDREIVTQHQSYWNEETIQDFWSGDSFYAIDEGQELSYNLAHILIRNITQDYEAFVQFANHVRFEDAGEDAALKYLGVSLANLVGSFLGEGNWEPEKRFERQAMESPCGHRN